MDFIGNQTVQGPLYGENPAMIS